MNKQTIAIGPRSMEEMNAFEHELTSIGQEAHRRVGQKDADYIIRVLYFVRITEALGRGLLMFGWFPPTWLLGAILLGLSKIVDNMELGHNVMHGQFSWMNDPRFHGDSFEWDNTCPKEGWRHTHNFVHHTYTNVIGKDRDFGYGMLRLSSELRWRWFYHPIQGFYMLLLAVFFEVFVALHELQTDKLATGRIKFKDIAPQWAIVKRKIYRQLMKDYVAWPLAAAAIAWPFGHALDAATAVMLGNVVGNLMRNVWAWAIIFCGHFTDDVFIFHRDSIKNETRGQWYLRQILGSSNIQGGKLLHFFSGNLSHQVEHHLFPDLPTSKYSEIAPKVEAVCKKYGVPYNTGYFFPQLLTVFKRVARYSLPGGSEHAVSIEIDSLYPEKI